MSIASGAVQHCFSPSYSRLLAILYRILWKSHGSNYIINLCYRASARGLSSEPRYVTLSLPEHPLTACSGARFELPLIQRHAQKTTLAECHHLFFRFKQIRK